MGKAFTDIFSLGHFGGGFIYYIVLKSLGVSDVNNFWISTLIHFIIENIEQDYLPTGEIIETFWNHTGDMFYFILGWSFGYTSDSYKYFNTSMIRICMLFAVIFTFNEIYREIYPKNITIFQGSYTYNVRKKYLL